MPKSAMCVCVREKTDLGAAWSCGYDAMRHDAVMACERSRGRPERCERGEEEANVLDRRSWTLVELSWRRGRLEGCFSW